MILLLRGHPNLAGTRFLRVLSLLVRDSLLEYTFTSLLSCVVVVAVMVSIAFDRRESIVLEKCAMNEVKQSQ